MVVAKERMAACLSMVVRMLVGVMLLIPAVFVLLALVSFDAAQLQGTGDIVANTMGPWGAWLAGQLIGAYGLAIFCLPIALFGLSISLLRGVDFGLIQRRTAATLLLLPVLAALVHLLEPIGWRQDLLIRWDEMELAGLGGRVGYFFSAPVGENAWAGAAHRPGLVVSLVGATGSVLLWLIALVGVMALFDFGLFRASREAWQRWQASQRAREAWRDDEDALRELSTFGGEAPQPEREMTDVSAVAERIERPNQTLDATDLVAAIRARREAIDHQSEVGDADGLLPAQADLPTATVTRQEMANEASVDEHAQATAASAAAAVSDDEARAEDGDAPLGLVPEQTSLFEEPQPISQDAAPRPAPKPAGAGYDLPSLEILKRGERRRASEHNAEIQEISQAIEGVFAEFRIDIKVVGANRGPVITQYELQLLEAGMRVNKVEGFEKDLSLRLGTEGIRIVAPLPNRKTVGVEVPNRIKEAVVMRDLVEEFDPADYKMPLILGRDVLGQALVGDLAKMPHLLVAGATGMGKSVCLNAIISSILLFRSPQEVKFIMVDPKMVELAPYDGIPHLLLSPITDMPKAHAALEWATKLMDERFEILKTCTVRDIGGFNELTEEQVRERMQRRGRIAEDFKGFAYPMPYVVIVVDEYADLMMVNKEVEGALVRLTAKARACGIHVILTTQRPSADVVTGLIKSNLPSRICFRVSDKSNSRVVLDEGGAENLLGKGDMLFLPPGVSNLTRGQGVWVRDPEIEAIIAHAQSQGEPEYDESILSAGQGAIAMAQGGKAGDGGDGWVHDRVFHEAVWSMFKADRTGADFLRRRLGIGYNKATSYVEQMEDLGFLGPAKKGGKSRDFLRSWDDWLDELKAAGFETDPDEECYTNPFSQ
jgi:S-DNA-T family DNA segregation ATPase FtsK/SpoIIIE